MTNQTTPPCPVCGVVPVKHAKNDRILLCGCFEEYGAMMTDVVGLQKYQLMCVDMLGRAMRDLGIETVAQVDFAASVLRELEKIGVTNLHEFGIVIKAAKSVAKRYRKKVDRSADEQVKALLDGL